MNRKLIWIRVGRQLDIVQGFPALRAERITREDIYNNTEI